MKKTLVLMLACAMLLTASLPALATSYEPVVHPAQRGASELLKEIVKTANPSASTGFWSLAEAVYGKLDAAVLSNEYVAAEAPSTGGFVRVTRDDAAEDAPETEDEPADETEEEVPETEDEPADETEAEPEDETEEEPAEEPAEEPEDEPAEASDIQAFWDALPEGEDTLGNTLKLKYEDIPEGEDSYVKLARGGYLWYGDVIYKFDLPGVGYTYCYADRIGGGSFYKYYTYEEAFALEAWVQAYPEL